MVAPCWGFCLPEPIGPGPPEPPLFFLPYQEPSTTVGTASIDQPGSGYTLVAIAGGLASTVSPSFAITARIPLTFSSVSVGSTSTCGVTIDGAAYCWGSNRDGAVGDGTRTERLTPVRVAGGVRFASISVGITTTCGLTHEGDAYCWGWNGSGKVGDGTRLDRLTPVRVAGGVRFASISLGSGAVCGVALEGDAYCWGSLNRLPPGDLIPVSVAGEVTFASVSVGLFHICGVTPEGAAYCWGSNDGGALGDGTTTGRLTPVPVAGGIRFASVTAGQDFGSESGQDSYDAHTCGVTPEGVAYCWGFNGYGQLGDGTTTGRLTPVPVAGGIRFASVTAGQDFGSESGQDSYDAHTCGVTPEGVAYCWGFNGYGQLGDGTTTGRLTPVPVAGGATFASVSAGRGHTCGVTTEGVAYCWGWNGFGQLGDGSETNRLTPVPVADLPPEVPGSLASTGG